MNPKLLGLLEGRTTTLDTHQRGEGRGEGASMRGLKAPALWHQQEVLLSETVTPRSPYPYSPTTEQFPLDLKCVFF